MKATIFFLTVPPAWPAAGLARWPSFGFYFERERGTGS